MPRQRRGTIIILANKALSSVRPLKQSAKIGFFNREQTMALLVLPCAKGCEQVLAVEAEALGLQNVKLGVSVVSGEGELEVAYRLCLWSRVASRVLWILREDEVSSPEDMYELARTIPWDDHLARDTTFAVHFNGIGQGIRNTQFGALKIKDAVVDTLREKLHQRPDVDSKNPDISIDAHLRKGKLTLALDLSGGSLHQRGYRSQQGIAPIKEHLAATLLYRANFKALCEEGFNVIDPMCGSGTLLLEGLLMAGDIAPALTRQKFGFEQWQSHKPHLWKALWQEARERREIGLNNLDMKLWGFDENPNALYAARENAKRLGLAHAIHFETRSVADFKHVKGYGERGIIVSNPPYGERLGEISDLVATYETLGAAFKTFPEAWQMALISSNTPLLKRLRLRQFKSYQAFNGALETEIALYNRAAQPESQDAIEAPAQHISEQARMFASRLRKNIRAAQKSALTDNTECYRLYDQDMPEYAVAIDVYGEHVHIQEYAPPKTVNPDKAKERLLDVLRATPELLEIPSKNVHLKTREKQSGKNQYQKQGNKSIETTVREGKALFRVNLSDYLDTGLFLDHRPMRYRLAQEANGKRFLNLFCYTASASVHAALGGASYTTSVDLSQTYLDWAHRNFDLNQLDNRHRLIKADVMEWIREGDSQFDLIFCDPPTFSNTKKEQRVFDVQRDHIALIEHCMRRLARDGVLYFSTNFRRFHFDEGLTKRFVVEDISEQTIGFDFVRRPKIHYVFKITHPAP